MISSGQEIKVIEILFLKTIIKYHLDPNGLLKEIKFLLLIEKIMIALLQNFKIILHIRKELDNWII